MAEVDKLATELKITQYDFDPDATTATEIAWVDMTDFESILVSFFRTVGTSNLTLTIIGNPASDGSGSDVTVATKTFTAGQPNAVGDYVFLEADAATIQQAAVAGGVDAVRYVTAVATVATATDEGVVTYVLGKGKKQDGLSADSIA